MNLAQFFDLSLADVEKIFKGLTFLGLCDILEKDEKGLAERLGLTGFCWSGLARIKKKSNPWCFYSINQWWTDFEYTFQLISPDFVIFFSIQRKKYDFGDIYVIWTRKHHQGRATQQINLDKTKRLRDFLIFDGSDNERIK